MKSQPNQMSTQQWAKRRNSGAQRELSSLFRTKVRASSSTTVKYIETHNQLVSMSRTNNAVQPDECAGDYLILDFRQLNTNTPQLYSKLVSQGLDVVLQMRDGVSHQINNTVVIIPHTHRAVDFNRRNHDCWIVVTGTDEEWGLVCCYWNCFGFIKAVHVTDSRIS